jgi:predicted ATPase
MNPIFVLNGTPGSGKTTLSKELMQLFPHGIHIPVDNLREWVVSGLAGPLDWSEETTRQFRLAESAAASVARRYQDAGFAVAIDHCQHLEHLDGMVEKHLAGRRVYKVLLLPTQEEALARNETRTTKDFDYAVLSGVITMLHAEFTEQSVDCDWLVYSNRAEEPAEDARAIAQALGLVG